MNGRSAPRDASSIEVSIVEVDSAEAARPNGALLFLAMAMVTVGMVGWGSALVAKDSSLTADQFRAVAASTLGLVCVGLIMGCLIWRHWLLQVVSLRASSLRLNRFHAVMSQTNRLILRRPTPSELLEGVCQICVKVGHLDLVLVDMSDVGEVHRAAATTSIGRVVTTSPQLLLDGARLQALMMTLALHTGECVIVDDAITDERLGESRAWCLATDLCALAAVPVRRGGALVGVLLLCSRSESFFDSAVAPLLSELGADLWFALDNADREQERRLAVGADDARVVAEDANRAKTEFLAQMSHELRTPLNAMLGFAQLLATDQVQVLSNGQAERVRLITHAGWHLLGLVNDVMDISRIESRRFEVSNVRGDISSVLDEAVALTQPLARAHHVELAERAASRFGIGAVADPRRLLQVLLNLLSNACKYNRPGGHVRVDVILGDTEVVVDVIDSGVGMTNEHLSHLFEPFNRLGNEGHAIEGSGIGLALTRQLVELMNGRLEIQSSPESGTRARLVLPACAISLEGPASEFADSSTAHDTMQVAVILYIEDDPVNRILVEQMLLRCDRIHLLQAEDGEHGIALARRRRPDLVLLDMHLPDMTGFDVLRALRADSRTRALQVVAVSANAVPADMHRAREMGVLDYWTKPLKLDAFLAGVASLLDIQVTVEGAGTNSA